jgi:hypothetical protein
MNCYHTLWNIVLWLEKAFLVHKVFVNNLCCNFFITTINGVANSTGRFFGYHRRILLYRLVKITTKCITNAAVVVGSVGSIILSSKNLVLAISNANVVSVYGIHLMSDRRNN